MERSVPVRLGAPGRNIHVGFCFLLGIAFLQVAPANAQHKQVQTAEPPQASSFEGALKQIPFEAYAGDAACANCHKEQAEAYLNDAHHLTSRWPDAQSIKGSFTPGSNILQTALPELTFEMIATNQGYFESADMKVDSGETVSIKKRIDIVIGSGRKAQTYLYWEGDQLFELPVSYWIQTKQWVNSPGYEDGTIHFDKAVVPRCLECHGSYFESLAPPLNRFSKTSLVLGIMCEKCHGPGRAHVALRSSNAAPHPGALEAIVNPSALSRARQMDVCSLCHAGAVRPIAPSLSFVPGDAIGKYLAISEPGPNIPVDVHGNQVELLKRSRCYRSSAMTCTTCHEVHKPQRDAASFSPYCLRCHKASACGMYTKIGDRITHDCVSCHMPLMKSELLYSDTGGQRLQPLVRDHRIAIYTDAQIAQHTMNPSESSSSH